MKITIEAKWEYIVRGVLTEHNSDVRAFNIGISEPKPITNITDVRELEVKLKEIFDVKSVTILECELY